jgi:hypothetical protein
MQRQFANFVEKRCPSVRGFKEPFAVNQCSRERTTDVAKQLAFHQLGRERCAVDWDETAAPSAQVVDLLR